MITTDALTHRFIPNPRTPPAPPSTGAAVGGVTCSGHAVYTCGADCYSAAKSLLSAFSCNIPNNALKMYVCMCVCM